MMSPGLIGFQLSFASACTLSSPVEAMGGHEGHPCDTPKGGTHGHYGRTLTQAALLNAHAEMPAARFLL